VDEVRIQERIGRDYEREYRNYLSFMSGAAEELMEIRGYGMLPSERDDFTRAYYAPEYREATHQLA
jgi:hypothetical protein